MEGRVDVRPVMFLEVYAECFVPWLLIAWGFFVCRTSALQTWRQAGDRPPSVDFRTSFLAWGLCLQITIVMVRFYIGMFSATFSPFYRDLPNGFPEIRLPGSRSG